MERERDRERKGDRDMERGETSDLMWINALALSFIAFSVKENLVL